MSTINEHIFRCAPEFRFIKVHHEMEILLLMVVVLERKETKSKYCNALFLYMRKRKLRKIKWLSQGPRPN